MSTARRIATDLFAALALVAFGLALPASRELGSGCFAGGAPQASVPEPSTGVPSSEHCEARLAASQPAGPTQGAHSFCDGDTLVTIEVGTLVTLELPQHPAKPAAHGSDSHAFARR